MFRILLLREYPSLESMFFVALNRFSETIRDGFELLKGFEIELAPAGGLHYSRYKGKSASDLERIGILPFNMGEGRFDSHGKGTSDCSMDIARKFYDFLTPRPWMQGMYDLVAANDKHGGAISKTSANRNIRESTMGLLGKHRQHPMIGINFCVRALVACFKLAKAGQKHDDPFGEAGLRTAVEVNDAEWLGEFTTRFNEGLDFMVAEFTRAKEDLKNGARVLTGKADAPDGPDDIAVFCPALKRDVHVGVFKSDSIKSGAAARSEGWEVAIIVNSGGKVNIFTQDPKVNKWLRKRFDLRKIAGTIRMEECRIRKIALPLEDREKIGTVADAIWYLPEFLNQLFNTSTGNDERPATKIPLSTIVLLVKGTLPKCGLIDNPHKG